MKTDKGAEPTGAQPELLRKVVTQLKREFDSGDIELRVQCLTKLVGRHSTYGTARSAPVREMMGVVGDKWSTLILGVLEAGKCRYSTLRQLVSLLSYEQSISHRVLTLKLRLVERDGLVIRKVWPTVPPRVEYELTDLGRSFNQQVESLISWAELHFEEIQRARAGFDSQPDDDGPDTDL